MQKSASKKRLHMAILWGVAFVWFTTHFGGGFASGAQMFAYYMKFGIWALIMPILAMAYNAFFFAYALHYAKKHQLYDYRSYNKHFYGKYSFIFSNLFELLYVVVMMLPPAVAFATGGSTISSLTGLPYIVSTLIIGVFIFIVAIFGTNIVRRVASILSILIVVGMFIVYIPNIFYLWGTISNNISKAAGSAGSLFLPALYSAFLYGTFQLTNIAVFVQHAESFDSPKDSVKSNIFGWIINSVMLFMTVLGLFSIVEIDGVSKFPVPVLKVTENGVGGKYMTWLISVLIILGAVSTAVNMVAAMTKRIQGTFENPEVTRKAMESGKTTKIAVIATLACCIIDFCIAQFGLIQLVSKGYSFIAYLTIPIIVIPYIVHMAVTNFDRKNPPRVLENASSDVAADDHSK